MVALTVLAMPAQSINDYIAALVLQFFEQDRQYDKPDEGLTDKHSASHYSSGFTHTHLLAPFYSTSFCFSEKYRQVLNASSLSVSVSLTAKFSLPISSHASPAIGP